LILARRLHPRHAIRVERHRQRHGAAAHGAVLDVALVVHRIVQQQFDDFAAVRAIDAIRHGHGRLRQSRHVQSGTPRVDAARTLSARFPYETGPRQWPNANSRTTPCARVPASKARATPPGWRWYRTATASRPTTRSARTAASASRTWANALPPTRWPRCWRWK